PTAYVFSSPCPEILVMTAPSRTYASTKPAWVVHGADESRRIVDVADCRQFGAGGWLRHSPDFRSRRCSTRRRTQSGYFVRDSWPLRNPLDADARHLTDLHAGCGLSPLALVEASLARHRLNAIRRTEPLRFAHRELATGRTQDFPDLTVIEDVHRVVSGQ